MIPAGFKSRSVEVRPTLQSVFALLIAGRTAPNNQGLRYRTALIREQALDERALPAAVYSGEHHEGLATCSKGLGTCLNRPGKIAPNFSKDLQHVLCPFHSDAVPFSRTRAASASESARSRSLSI